MTGDAPAPASPSPPLSRPTMQDHDRQLERLRRGELLSVAEVSAVCQSCKSAWIDQSNVIQLSTPITAVGDIHGQFNDVLEMLKIGGEPPFTNYLFLGDYVDRGPMSISVISYLLVLYLRYPTRVTILRGNHECRSISKSYGFYAECLAKYDDIKVWTLFTDVFDYMPIAAIIDNEMFCAHGGLSPAFQTIDDVRALDRFMEIPFEGPMCDLIWGDPDADHEGFRLSTRGAGYTFGKDIVDKFLFTNRMQSFIRAHQLCHEGYSILWDTFVTVWSAPNYCGRMGNRASILQLTEHGEKLFNVYGEAPKEACLTSAQSMRTNTKLPPGFKSRNNTLTSSSSSLSLSSRSSSPSASSSLSASSSSSPYAHLQHLSDAELDSAASESGALGGPSKGWKSKVKKNTARKSIAATKKGGYAYQ